MKLFHRTVMAAEIFTRGFNDRMRIGRTAQPGIWLADVPLSPAEGSRGWTLLAAHLPKEFVLEYRVPCSPKPYAEWFIPARILNAFAGLSIFEDKFAGSTQRAMLDAASQYREESVASGSAYLLFLAEQLERHAQFLADRGLLVSERQDAMALK